MPIKKQRAKKPGSPVVGSEDVGGQQKPTDTSTAETLEVFKSDIPGFVGELSVDLDREMEDGSVLRDKLSDDVAHWLKEELKNQEKLIEKLASWDKQYCGKKPEKVWPYVGCHNTAVPITRIDTDAIVVRIFDVIGSQKKRYVCNARKEEYVEIAGKLEDALDWWQKDVVNLKEKLFSPIMQAVKTGSSFVKLAYIQKNRTQVRYASPAEIVQKVPGLIKFKNGQYGIKKVITTYNGPDVQPISREDFVYSSDATTIENAFMCGFRFYLRKPEVKLRAKQGLWFQDSVDKLLGTDEIDETKVKRAETRGLEIISDEKAKQEIWELWLRYDVDEDGEEDDIVITFHLGTKTILRATYNPLFMGFRPFVAFTFSPREYSLEGEGTCEILEKLQLEIDAIHNARLDRLDQINAPMVLVEENSGFDTKNFHLAPGLVTETNVELSENHMPVKFINFPELYPSTWAEENLLVEYAQQALGIGPAALGQPTSERPVARETYQLIQEMNKKFKFGIDNIRDDEGELATKAAMMMAQYQPKYSYFTAGPDGMLQEETLDFPFEFLRDSVGIELTASSELLNVETRRENNLIAYQLMSDYDTKLAGMVQAILDPNMPPAMKMFLFQVSQQGFKILTEFLDDLGKKDSKTLIAQITPEIMQAAMQPPPPMPPGGPPTEGGEPPPQGGVPPMGGPGGPPPQAGPPPGMPPEMGP